jgi:tartrate dehydratase beta subunit/fumarate hydratase class I family protein
LAITGDFFVATDKRHQRIIDATAEESLPINSRVYPEFG